MYITYEEAYFYKLLLENGFVGEVDQWIDNIAVNNDTLEGINLDLVSALGDSNKIISSLHNYLLDKKIDDKSVCERLRLFIKDKVDNDKISILEAANILYYFSCENEKMHEEYWHDFYTIGIYKEYFEEDFLDEAEFNSIVKQFLETGNQVDANDFWNKRNEKYTLSRKKERKCKVFCALGLVLYSLLIFLLSYLFMLLEKELTGTISDKTMGIHIIVVGLLLVTPIVICVVGWDMVYDFLSTGKTKCKEIKKERDLVLEKRKIESDDLREKYNLDKDILTSYEYNSLSMKSLTSKRKWILLAIFEVLCLSMTIGSVFYFDLVIPEVGITIMLAGLSVGIYGFCILCDAAIKGIYYSTIPVLCYALPLVIVYYLLGIKTEWIIGLSTILFGSLLFILFMIFTVVKPLKKYNKVSIEYYDMIETKYSNMKYLNNFIHKNVYLTFWKKDGTHIDIFEYKEGCFAIVLSGKIIFNDVLLKNVIISYKEEKDDFDTCVLNALKILNEYNE